MDLFQFYFKIASCNFEAAGCGESVVSPCYGYGVVSVHCLSKCCAFRRDLRLFRQGFHFWYNDN